MPKDKDERSKEVVRDFADEKFMLEYIRTKIKSEEKRKEAYEDYARALNKMEKSKKR